MKSQKFRKTEPLNVLREGELTVSGNNLFPWMSDINKKKKQNLVSAKNINEG